LALERQGLWVRLPVRECVEVGHTRRLLGGQHFVQQQLDADVRDCASRTAREASLAKRDARGPRQSEEAFGPVKGCIGPVVQLDTPDQVRVQSRRWLHAQHRKEVGQHGAQHETRGRFVPGGDRGMAEKVHVLACTAWARRAKAVSIPRGALDCPPDRDISVVCE